MSDKYTFPCPPLLTGVQTLGIHCQFPLPLKHSSWREDAKYTESNPTQRREKFKPQTLSLAGNNSMLQFPMGRVCDNRPLSAEGKDSCVTPFQAVCIGHIPMMVSFEPLWLWGYGL